MVDYFPPEQGKKLALHAAGRLSSTGSAPRRRLCEEVHLNLAYRWFCRLGLDSVPERSSFSKNRHGRFCEGDLFRRLFEEVVRRCVAAGLVGGTGAVVDGSVIEADASRERRCTAIGFPRHGQIGRSQAQPVRAYLMRWMPLPLRPATSLVSVLLNRWVIGVSAEPG